MSGAKTATTTKARTKKAPTIAPGLRRRRCHASLQRPPAGASRASSADSSSAIDISDHLASRSCSEALQRADECEMRARGSPLRPPVPDPGIEDRVRDVDDQVHEHEDDREKEDPALEERGGAGEERVGDPAS